VHMDVAGIDLRRLAPTDSIADLTTMLHAAYAPLAAAGMRFLATHQDERTTAYRASKGECWVAVETASGRIVGTVTIRTPDNTRGCPWYDRGDVASASQFAVDPAWQGRGLGSALMRLAEERAAALGAAEIAVDTAETAAHLIAMYERWGFRRVGMARWEAVNYASVVLSRTLR
jgi:ribosomal protein S18 acetylase RimI-like enzyme